MPPRREKRSDNRFSLEVSNALETKNFGLSQRDETKRTQLIGQFLEEYFAKTKSIASGGRAEGTALDESSDSDRMGVIGGFLVVENDNVMDENMICISAVKTGCSPGYCKLKFSAEQYSEFMLGLNLQANKINCYSFIKNSIVSLADEYISSKLFCKKAIPLGMVPADNIYDVSFEVNGPAIRNFNVDHVQAFEMSKWPKEAKIWKTRSRKYEWPDIEFLNRVEDEVACYVVPIGNRSSTEFDMEWRLSFVEIERELIWSMNETQFKCFILLKKLKEIFRRYPALVDITTYHLKNIMFWMCEDVPECDWIPRNLISCVKGCIKKLKICVKQKKLDHFIIPENNLFQSKTFDSKEIEKAINSIQRIELYKLLSEICEDGKYLKNLLLVSPEVTGYIDTCKFIWGYCAIQYDSNFYENFIENFPDSKLLRPCVQLSQERTKWREELTKVTVGESSLAKSVVDKIKEGSTMDYSTGTIYAAIVYFMHDYYEEVSTELKPLLANKAWKIYVSSDGPPRYLCFQSGEMHAECKELIKNVKIPDIDRKNLVNDFYTVYADVFDKYGKKYLLTLPYPLALQSCINTERIQGRYNPVVICYYLLYMSQLKLGNVEAMEETMRCFKRAVWNNKDRQDYYFSLVLLGHALYWKGDVKAAFKYFAKSMRIKKSVQNAAVYHMAFTY